MLGSPAEIVGDAIGGVGFLPSDPNEDLWMYHDKTRDPTTGKRDPDLYIWFRHGRVVHVSTH